MMIPMQSIIIPEFVNIANAGPRSTSSRARSSSTRPSGPRSRTYLMTTYYRGIPTELIEASVMDGACYWQIFRKIMLPLALPAITTVAVLQVIQIWDDLLVGLLFLQTPDVRTITVGLATLQTSRMVNVPRSWPARIVSVLPAIIVYLIFQRNLIAGLTMGVNK